MPFLFDVFPEDVHYAARDSPFIRDVHYAVHECPTMSVCNRKDEVIT